MRKIREVSVEQTNVVDYVGTSKDGHEVILTISDQLEWDAENKHLRLLQGKLNSYLRFIESGEILDAYPSAKGKPIVIKIYALHTPDGDVLEFLASNKNTIEEAGIGFRLEQHDFEEEQ